MSVKTRCKKDDDEGVCVCLYVSVGECSRVVSECSELYVKLIINKYY